MFDIGWSELLVIAMVAVVVVGPKDLPRLLRGVGNFVGRMKRMSRDFQRQFNDALREAELDDVKKSVEQIGKIDPLADVKKDLAPARKLGDDIRRELGVPVASAVGVKAAEPKPGVNLAVPLNGEGKGGEGSIAEPASETRTEAATAPPAANGAEAKSEPGPSAPAEPAPMSVPVNGAGHPEPLPAEVKP